MEDSLTNLKQEIENLDNFGFIEELGANPVEIIVGINIPGIKPIIDKIIKLINEKQSNMYILSKKYLEKENCLRNLYSIKDDKKKEEMENEIEQYRDKLYYDIKQISTIKKIILDLDSNECNEEAKEYYNLFYDDYLHIFIFNNEDLIVGEEYNMYIVENWKRLIKDMVKRRFGDGRLERFKKLSDIILWIESHKKYIVLILLIYKKLSSFVDLLNEKMDGFILNNGRSEEVNECFFLYNESMIRLILRENNLNDKIKENLINTIKEIYHYSSQLNYELNLHSKELKNLKTFLDIAKIFREKEENSEQNIKHLIEILIDKKKVDISEQNLTKEEIKEIFDNIDKLYNFLNEKIGTHKSFSRIINEILYGEYASIKDDEFRKKILELILNNKSIIKDSHKIFYECFKNIIMNNFQEFIKEEPYKDMNNPNEYYELIEKTLDKDNKYKATKIKLEQLLLNLFEGYFLVFFQEIPKRPDNILQMFFSEYYESKDDEELIMLGHSFIMFTYLMSNLQNIIKNSEDNKEIRYPNITKLYSIAYIKIYLYKTICFIFSERKSLNGDIKKIIEEVSNLNLRKVINIYILKLINSFYNNYQGFLEFNNKSLNFDFLFDFFKGLREEKKVILNYYFIQKENLEVYNEFNKILHEYIKILFRKGSDSILNYIKEENIDIFYSVVTNEIISNLDLQKDLYSEFSKFSQEMFENQTNIPDTFKKLFSLFINESSFKEKIRETILSKKEGNINDIDYELFEIILTSMRFCIQTAYNQKQNNLYYNILTKNILKIINNLPIPGIDLMDKISFIQKDKTIRNLSQVGYRLLNFIFYSHLYFSDRMGYINE